MEDEVRVMLIHGRKAGVMLRGETLESWEEGGKRGSRGRERWLYWSEI